MTSLVVCFSFALLGIVFLALLSLLCWLQRLLFASALVLIFVGVPCRGVALTFGRPCAHVPNRVPRNVPFKIRVPRPRSGIRLERHVSRSRRRAAGAILRVNSHASQKFG